MINSTVKAIIFDFGGVIININYQDTIEAFKALGIEDFETMYTQAQQSDLFNDIETGKISAQRFINGVLDYLPSGTSPNAVVSAWNSMIKDVPSKTLDLLLQLKAKGYKLYLLSNTNEIHIDAALRAWDKTNHERPEHIFDKVYLSHEMGMRKPNREIFEFVCEAENLIPSETLFIDDSIQHIEGATSIGLQTHHLLNQEEIYSLFS